MTDAVMRPVRTGDVERLTAVMRAEDEAEVRATGIEPLEALRRSLSASAESFAVELGDELAAIAGVIIIAPVTFAAPEYGIAWMLTGGAVSRHRGAFWRLCLRVLPELLERHPVVLNMIDARYVAALRWARRLRGEVCPAVPWGASGELFHPVVWRRSAWAQA